MTEKLVDDANEGWIRVSPGKSEYRERLGVYQTTLTCALMISRSGPGFFVDDAKIRLQ